MLQVVDFLWLVVVHHSAKVVGRGENIFARL
jgi:hypothetical protein